MSVLLFSCKPSTPPAETQSTEQTTVPTSAGSLPSITEEEMRMLWDSCDYVDYLFYDLPVSMSLNEQGSIRSSLSYIAKQPAELKPSCKSLGRVFFIKKGETILEADIYFSPGCTYYVFRKENKAVYANLMSEAAFKFFNRTIMQIQQ